MTDTGKGFSDALLTSDGGTFICYRSGLMVCEEMMSGGRYVSAGWNGAGYPLNVLDKMPTRLRPVEFSMPQAFDIEADGASLTYSWKFKEFEKNREKLENGTEVTHAVVTLENGAAPVIVRVHTILDGTSVFERYIVLENSGEKPLNISRLCVMGGALESMNRYGDWMGEKAPEKVYSLGYFEYAQWGHEGAFRWHDLDPEMTTVFGRYHRKRYRHPMFILRNNLTGTIYYAQLAYSGGYAMSFDLNVDSVDKSDDSISLSYAIELDSVNPVIILQPWQSYKSPSVHIGMMNGELDDIVNEMHTHIRRSVFTLPPAGSGIPGGLVEAGMGPERVMDVAATKHFADTAALVGAETMIIDAGWYCPPGKQNEWSQRAGDWSYNTELYPNGIEEIRDYIHSKGLLFGMWLDAERLGKASKAASEHPDWITKPYTGEESSLIDMANPEACAWVEKQIGHLIEDYKIDLFRLDWNVGCLQISYKKANGEPGTARYCEAAYAMYERLRRKYPHVVFENCAGGGGRTDLGFVKYFTHTWVSDWQIAPRSAAITNGMTMALPPEYVDRLVSGMNSHTVASLDFMVRHTLFGRPTTNDYNPVGSKFNPGQIEFVKHSFDLYKTYVRPYACEGKIYHHTPEIYGRQPGGVCILERSDKDATVGIIGIFTLANTRGEEIRVYPRGIDVSKKYEILFDNDRRKSIVSGYSMRNEGIRIHIGKSLSSELLAYRALN